MVNVLEKSGLKNSYNNNEELLIKYSHNLSVNTI